MEAVTYTPIGVIHSPFTDPVGMPIQTAAAKGIAGSIEVLPEYLPGLQDLADFSYIILLYHLHLITGSSLVVTPFLDKDPHGIFATRAPRRPNPLGLSVVRLLAVEGAVLRIEDVDIVDGTPLLDIKPYVPALDVREPTAIGWYAKNLARLDQARADDRFR